jgi:hypothetical protein
LASTTRNLLILLILAAVAIAGFSIGKWMGNKQGETKLIENYNFVRNIVELATLEVNGTATYTSTNVDKQESWWNSVSAFFTEKSAIVSVPYQAKYGVDVSSDSIHIEKKDSVLEIRLPAAKLLSYELRLDRMQTLNKKGLFVFSDDEFYVEFQKKLYAQSRAQMERNEKFLASSKARIEEVLQLYFQPFNTKVKCIYR